jgi:cellulose biosynthesis protein BcsQ
MPIIFQAGELDKQGRLRPELPAIPVELLADHDPPALTTSVGQRVSFADAARSGRLVGEIDGDGLAAREIVALAAEIEKLAR